MANDDGLVGAFRSGAIKAIVADRIRDGTIGTRIARRQDLTNWFIWWLPGCADVALAFLLGTQWSDHFRIPGCLHSSCWELWVRSFLDPGLPP